MARARVSRAAVRRDVTNANHVRRRYRRKQKKSRGTTAATATRAVSRGGGDARVSRGGGGRYNTGGRDPARGRPRAPRRQCTVRSCPFRAHAATRPHAGGPFLPYGSVPSRRFE